MGQWLHLEPAQRAHCEEVDGLYMKVAQNERGRKPGRRDFNFIVCIAFKEKMP